MTTCRLGENTTVAIDDTKEHRTGRDGWGTCTFHESAARGPNRAKTVRAPQLGGDGGLISGQPWTYLPVAARLYFRKSQLPAGERFKPRPRRRWKCSDGPTRHRQSHFGRV